MNDSCQMIVMLFIQAELAPKFLNSIHCRLKMAIPISLDIRWLSKLLFCAWPPLYFWQCNSAKPEDIHFFCNVRQGNKFPRLRSWTHQMFGILALKITNCYQNVAQFFCYQLCDQLTNRFRSNHFRDLNWCSTCSTFICVFT